MNLIGHPAPLFDTPAFTPNQEHSEVSLESLRGKWILLFFYPLDFTIVCPTEISALQEKAAEFKERNCEVISISVDSTFSHEAWCKRDLGQVDFIMASDITKRISRDYGVLDEKTGVALRGTHIIDPEGKVQYSLCHNLKVGRNIPEILKTLEALQTRKNCLANWQK